MTTRRRKRRRSRAEYVRQRRAAAIMKVIRASGRPPVGCVVIPRAWYDAFVDEAAMLLVPNSTIRADGYFVRPDDKCARPRFSPGEW